MAEYAGLEIRIGGDTTKLNKALKASVGAAAELQREIRQITTAMQFDPKNLGNVSTRIKLTSDRMEALRAKVQLSERAMEQLGEQATALKGDVEGSYKTVKQLADETKNVAMEAKHADERYNEVVSTIATLYEQFNKVSKNAAIKELAEKVDSVSTATEICRMSAEDFNAAMRRWNVPESFAKRIDQLRNMQFHFEGRTGELDKMLETMKKLGVFTQEDVAQVKELQRQFGTALDNKKAYDLADQFQELGVRIARDKAEVEGLSTVIRELDAHSKVSMDDSFIATKKQIDDIDLSIKSLEEDMKRADATLRLDPKNLGVAKRMFDDMTQKADLLNRREELLRQNLDRLDTPGLREAMEGHKNLAEWIEQARVSAQKARSTYTDQFASLKNLETAAERTASSIELLKSRMSAYEMGVAGNEQFDAVAEQAHEASVALDVLKMTWKDANGSIKPEAIAAEFRKLTQDVEKTNAAFKRSQEDAAFYSKGIYPDEIKDKYQQAAYEVGTRLDYARDSLKQFKATWDTLDSNGNNRLQMASDIEEAERSVERLEGELKELNKVKVASPEDYEKWKQELKELEAEYPKLNRQIDRMEQEVRESQAAMERANKELDTANQASEFRDLTAEIEKNTAAKKENARAFDGEGASIFTPSNIKSWGMTLYSTVTPMISSMGYAMVSASEDIDSAYRNMRKTVDGTEQDFQRLYDAAVQFSTTHVTSAAQLLEIEAIGGELGIATENLQEFGEVVASLADSTNLSAEDAATALGHLANIMKIEPDDYSGFADALVRLGNNGASTEEEIANIAERIGSMGAIVGMSTPDVLALASTIAATGQNSEAAGTAISKTMSFMETAVAAAGGTMEVTMESVGDAIAEGGDQLTIFASMAGMTADEFVEAWSGDPESAFEGLKDGIEGAKNSLQMIADVAGMTADDFAKTWESDPTAALEAFIKGLNNIEAAGGSADSTLVNLGITSVRQKQAIEGLMQTVGLLDDNLEMSENAWNGVSDQWGQAGDAANEAAKKAEGFSGQLQILKNMADAALASLGEGAVPIMKDLSGMLADLTTWFTGLSTEMKKSIIEAGLFMALLGPGLTLVSTIITTKANFADWAATSMSAFAQVSRTAKLGGSAMVESLKGVGTAGGTAQAAIVALEGGMKALLLSMGKFALIGGAVYAVSTLVSEVVKAREEMKLAQRATGGLRDAIDGIARATGNYSSALPPVSRSTTDLIAAVDDLRQHQADLADELDRSNTEYSRAVGPVEYYARTIEKLMDDSDRSEAETQRLKSAIEALNDECGTSYALNDYGEIIDTQTGQVIDNTEAIWDNVEARRAQAVVDFYSGSYNDAVANMQEAEDVLDGLLAKREDLQASPFFGKELWEIDEADLADFERWNAEWSANEQAISQAETAYNDASAAVEELEAKIDEATGIVEANKLAHEEAAAAAEEAARRQEIVADDVTGNMKRMFDTVGDDKAFNDLADSLDMLTVSANELDGVDMSRFAGSFDGSITDVMAALEDGGVSLITFRAAMENAGVSSETLSGVTARAFQAMYESCGGNIDKTMESLNHMTTTMGEVDGRQVTFYIGDNGTITDAEGRVYDLETDIADIPDEVLVAFYGDNKDALDKARAAKAEAQKTDGTTATVSINATDNATDTISSVRRQLDNLPKSKTITINTLTKGKQATGGYNTRPVIPEHATGYIAKGPTLTNQGWVGEDGIEAVANWATGGAVVPLTNTKYMLPIADAIAEGMAQRGAGGGGVTYNLYVNDARVNDDPAIRSAFIGLMTTLERKGAMNVGNR